MAALCLAYLQTGQYGLHESTQLDVQASLASSDDPHAQMLYLMAVASDGDKHQLEQRLQTLDELLGHKRHWGIASLARSRILSDIATHQLRFEADGKSSLQSFQEAFLEYQRARHQLGDSQMVINHGPMLLIRAIEASQYLEGTMRKEWREELESILKNIKVGGDQIWALHVAVGYLQRQGREEQANALEESIVQQFKEGTYPYASVKENFRPNRLRGPAYAQDPTIEEKLCYATALACDDPSGSNVAEIEALLFGQVFAEPQAIAWYTLAADIPCILGRKDMLKRLCELAKRCPGYDQDWICFTRYMQFMNDEIEESDYLREAGPFTRVQAGCHYGVALKYLLNRQISEAEKHFAKAEECRIVTTFPYHNAHFFREKLRSGWLTGRKVMEAVLDE